NAAKIDAVVRVEAPILDRDHGMDQIRRQPVDFDLLAFGGTAGRKDLTVSGCENDCRTGLVGIAAARDRHGDSTIADKPQDRQCRRRTRPPQADQDRTPIRSQRAPPTAPISFPLFIRNEKTLVFVPVYY